MTRAKIELRERTSGGQSPKTEIDDVRTAIAALIDGRDEQAQRWEASRIDSQRAALAALLRSVLTVAERLERCEAMLGELHALAKNATPTKEWYTVAETAAILGKAEFTVREWCRLGRVHAAKRECGRGTSQEWVVSHKELLRVQNEGLLPE